MRMRFHFPRLGVSFASFSAQTEKDVIETDLLSTFDEENRKIYIDMLERAIATMEEQECDTWRTMFSRCCGAEQVCIRSSVQVIGKSDTSYLFYAMIHNVQMM